jgi:hypothetical protein
MSIANIFAEDGGAGRIDQLFTYMVHGTYRRVEHLSVGTVVSLLVEANPLRYTSSFDSNMHVRLYGPQQPHVHSRLVRCVCPAVSMILYSFSTFHIYHRNRGLVILKR